MAKNTERRFTLRAVLQDLMSKGLDTLSKKTRTFVPTVKQMVTGLGEADQRLAKTASAAAKAGKALEGVKGLPSRFGKTDDELNSAARAAQKLEQALDGVASTPGAKALKPGDARALRETAQAAAEAQRNISAALRTPENEREGTEELKKAADAVEKLARSGEGLDRVTSGLAQQNRQVSRGTRLYNQLAAATRVVKAGLRGVAGGARVVVGAFGRVLSIGRRVLRTLISFRTLAVVVVGLAAARGVTRYADAWTELGNRLKLVTDTQEQLQRSTNDVFEVAQRSRQPIDAVADTYFRYARASKELRGDQDRLANVTELTAKAIAISGTTAESASAALFQFGQGLAADALRGQELNSVLEQTPRLAIAIADGLGVGVGQLRALAAEGKLTAKEVIEALESQSDAIEREFAETSSTIGQALTRLDNSVGRAVAIFAGETGATSGIVSLINGITDSVDNLMDRLEDRFGGFRVLVGQAFDPNIPRADRELARQNLGRVFEGVGDVLDAIFRSAGNVVVQILVSGVRGLLAGVLPVLEDFFRDQVVNLVSIIPGGSKLAPGVASLSKQLREGKEEAIEFDEKLEDLEGTIRTLNTLIELPGVEGSTSSREELTSLKARRSELKKEAAEVRRDLGDTNAAVTQLAADINRRNEEIAINIDRSLVEGVGGILISAKNAKADIGKAGDALLTTIENVVPKAKAAGDDAGAAIESTGRSIGQIFDDISREGTLSLDTLKENLGGAIADIEKRSADLVARKLEAVGREQDAARIRLLQLQREQLAETPEPLRGGLEETQRLELQRFDLDRERVGVVDRLSAASERLTETERRLETQVKIGNITKIEARKLSDEQREAFDKQSEAALAELDVLEARFPQFQQLIAETRAELKKLIEGAQDDEPPKKGFYKGFKDALADIREEAGNTYRLGQQFANALTSNLTNGLLNAIEAGIRGTKSWGEAFRQWAVDTLVAIGRVLAQAALLYAVALGLEAIAPGIASLLGLSVKASAGQNDGGVVGDAQGFNQGGQVGSKSPLQKLGNGLSFVKGPRGPNRDTVVTALTTGEVVWSRPAVDQLGGAQAAMRLHDSIIQGARPIGFNSGGLVGSPAVPSVNSKSSGGGGSASPQGAVLDLNDGGTREKITNNLLRVFVRGIGEEPVLRNQLKVILGD